MKISKARLKEIIKEEVRLHQNEGVGAYLDNDIKNLIQRATRDYEISTEEVALALHAAAKELDGNMMNEVTSKMRVASQIERLLNDLFDSGFTNQDLKEVLIQVMENIDAGFVGEPS
jgi:transcriptional regulator NrdR family protein